ncbi:hypothetical protein [Neobacillus kokaensis]|uniref:DUF1878 domain-containing protein n=1 Tax=Neobacillus kokaensis TaxID=2759023 RepID=A0ABQ3N600_9BACI|nr:hypothetical protein [Neobacillus kokaensis]GHH98952.1 hypothetical protein AM1BK_24950 [Neobacillus kokaensis]
MNFEMQKANLLAENIDAFIKFVHKRHENKNSLCSNPDKVYQIKLIMEDFKFQIIADELRRINQFDWDPKYTHYLVDQFLEGFRIIEEFVKNNYSDLFIFIGRIYTLDELCHPFKRMTQ